MPVDKKAYQNSWYAELSEEKKRLRQDVKNSRRREIRAFIQGYKFALGCKYCSERDPNTLDFNHLDPSLKYKAIADGVRDGWGKKKLMEEIKKCELVCSNCHRKLTHSTKGAVL